MKYKDMTYTVRKDGRYMKKKQHKNKTYYLYSNSVQDLYNQYIELSYLTNKNLTVDDNSITMEQWSLEWLRLYKSDKQENTKKMYHEAIKNYINPYLGKYKLKSIKQKNILDLLNVMTSRGITRRKEVVLMTLRQIFDKAIDNDYISKNPCNGIKLKRHKSAEKTPLPHNLIVKIQKLARINPHAFLILFMVYTGLRKQEVIPLQYKDIDLNNRYITVNKAVELIHNQPIIKPTKNEDIRNVPILNVIYDKLYEMKLEHKDTDYVFPNSNGKMMSDTTMKRKIINVRKELSNITEHEVYFTYHQLRHTYVCILHKAGIDLKEAQYFTGHKTLKVLLDIYTHLDDKDKQKAIDKLNNFIA